MRARGESPADSAADRFFHRAEGVFRQATETVGRLERTCCVAGHEVRLVFAGDALLGRLLPALAPYASPPSDEPQLVVHLWDSSSTGTRMAEPAWGPDAYGPHGRIAGFNTRRFHTAVEFASNALSMLDTDRREALFWIADATHVCFQETVAPLRSILFWHLSGQGLTMVHAAAVAGPRGGVLLAGGGGSGKSTSALACLQAGWEYVGDNNVLLAEEAGAVAAHGVYGTLTLHEHHLRRRCSFLLDDLANRDRLGEEKALLFVADRYPGQVRSRLAVQALVLPRVSARAETLFHRTSTADGLRALAPSTIFSLPGAGTGSFRSMARLARQLPTYVLECGTDLAGIPRALAGLLGDRTPVGSLEGA